MAISAKHIRVLCRQYPQYSLTATKALLFRHCTLTLGKATAISHHELWCKWSSCPFFSFLFSFLNATSRSKFSLILENTSLSTGKIVKMWNKMVNKMVTMVTAICVTNNSCNVWKQSITREWLPRDASELHSGKRRIKCFKTSYERLKVRICWPLLQYFYHYFNLSLPQINFTFNLIHVLLNAATFIYVWLVTDTECPKNPIININITNKYWKTFISSTPHADVKAKRQISQKM